MTQTNLTVFDADKVIKNFDAFTKMATCFTEGKALPNGITTAPQLIMIMQAGVDLGLSVTEAMQSLSIINGRVTMYGEVVTKRIFEHGYSLKFDSEEVGYVKFEKNGQQYERLEGHCTVTLSKGDKSHTETFTVAEAKDAGLLDKDNWKKYPKLMLRYRAIRNAVKFFCPEVMGGVPMYEEMKDEFGDGTTPKRSSAFERVDTTDDILEGFETRGGSEVIDADTIPTENTNPEPLITEELANTIAEAIIEDAIEDEVISQEEAEELDEKPESDTVKSMKESLELGKRKKAEEIQSVKEEEPVDPSDATIKIGSTVKSKLMGEGVVEDIYGNSVLVKFVNVGLKKVSIELLEFVK